MKRFLGVFELSKDEQRVVLIIMLILLTIAFIAYERRIYPRSQQTTAIEPNPPPTVVQSEDGD